jgi:hypothetical protein
MKSSLHSLIPFLPILLTHPWLPSQWSQVKVKVTLRLTVSQSVRLGVEPRLRHTTRYYFLFESYCPVHVGRPLWREVGSVVCNCYWPSLAQSFSGPSPVGPVAIFYCLRFETSLFVGSYDSQGHRGGIRPRLHTVGKKNQSLTRFGGTNARIQWSLSLSLMLRPTVSGPVCLGIKHPFGAYDQILIIVWQVRVCWCGAPSLTWGRVCRLQLLLALASAVIFWSESRGTHDHILLSQIRDFPFRRLIRLAGSRWRYSTLPPHGDNSMVSLSSSRYITSGRPQHTTPFPNNSSIVLVLCLPHRCIETAVVACVFVAAENVFNESLPSNERLFWLHYFDFQALCHSILNCFQISLPKKPICYRPLLNYITR